MSTPDSNGSVNYTVKELLARMDSKLDSIDGKLETKADAAIVAALTVRVDRLDRGEFSEAARRAITAAINTEVAARSTGAWTAWQRWLYVGGAVVGFSVLALNIYVAFRGGS